MFPKLDADNKTCKVSGNCTADCTTRYGLLSYTGGSNNISHLIKILVWNCLRSSTFFIAALLRPAGSCGTVELLCWRAAETNASLLCLLAWVWYFLLMQQQCGILINFCPLSVARINMRNIVGANQIFRFYISAVLLQL